MENLKWKPRFQVGDKVRLVRSGVPPKLATILEVNTRALVPHYVIAFDGGPLSTPIPEYDLAPVAPRQEPNKPA